MFDFEKEILQRSSTIPVIVEFSAPGCGPCKWMESTLIEIVKEKYGMVEFVSLPIADCIACVKQYQIVKNPTTILFSNGKAIAKLNGALPKGVIEQWLSDHIKSF